MHGFPQNYSPGIKGNFGRERWGRNGSRGTERSIDIYRGWLQWRMLGNINVFISFVFLTILSIAEIAQRRWYISE